MAENFDRAFTQIMAAFPFEKVQARMHHCCWVWAFGATCRVPTADELRTKASELLSRAFHGPHHNIATGGFLAERLEDSLRLSFGNYSASVSDGWDELWESISVPFEPEAPSPASPTPLEQSHRELLEALREVAEAFKLYSEDRGPRGLKITAAIANAEKLEANNG